MLKCACNTDVIGDSQGRRLVRLQPRGIDVYTGKDSLDFLNGESVGIDAPPPDVTQAAGNVLFMNLLVFSEVPATVQ